MPTPEFIHTRQNFVRPHEGSRRLTLIALLRSRLGCVKQGLPKKVKSIAVDVGVISAQTMHRRKVQHQTILYEPRSLLIWQRKEMTGAQIISYAQVDKQRC